MPNLKLDMYLKNSKQGNAISDSIIRKTLHPTFLGLSEQRQKISLMFDAVPSSLTFIFFPMCPFCKIGVSLSRPVIYVSSPISA